jgi:hypothetical protein
MRISANATEVRVGPPVRGGMQRTGKISGREPASVRNDRQRPVIIAMVAVRMMEPAVNEIIDMVAMRHGLVAAVGSVTVCRIVASGMVLRITAVRIAVAYGDHMMLGAAALGMLQVAVIEIINVAFMPHGEMTASGAMNVVRSLARNARFWCHGGFSVAHPQSSRRIMPKLASAEKRTSRRLLATAQNSPMRSVAM